MTANRERGESALALAGSVYVLRLTVEACVALEATTAATFDRIVAGLKPGSVKEWRALLWAALQDRNAAAFPTLERVGEAMQAAGGLGVLRPALVAFLALNEPNKDTLPRPTRGAPKASTPTGWGALLVEARTLGIAAEAFWRFTLRELWLELEAGRRRRKDERDRAITTAWYAAALVWQQKLPSLATLLRDPNQPQSRAEARLVLETMAAQIGKSTIRVPRGTVTH